MKDLIAINKASKLFKESMQKINVNVYPSGIASNLDEVWRYQKKLVLSSIIRPAFTLGVGGGIVFNLEEFVEPVNQVWRKSNNQH